MGASVRTVAIPDRMKHLLLDSRGYPTNDDWQDYPCKIWTKSIGSHGYGQKSVGGRRGSVLLAHRLAWEEKHGPIPDGLFVLHHCDNRACCEEKHLFLGTQADNMRDMTEKGRNVMTCRTHCPSGHEYTPENTRVLTYKDGSRHRGCRECHRLGNIERRRRSKEGASSRCTGRPRSRTNEKSQ